MQIIKPETKKTSILPLLVVVTFGLHLFSLLLLLFHNSMIQALQKQLTPQSLVQLVDGRAITVDAQETDYRNPETIRRFVGETMTLMLTWSQQQPPLIVWQISSQLLASDLKPKFQAEITNLNPTGQLANINRQTEYVLVIEKISQPTKIANGKWKVEMLANQLNFSPANNLGTSTEFNKQIFIRATDKPVATLPTQPLPWHLAAYRLGEARLEIYQICDLKDNTCS
ncbi:hypothetical protein VB620_06590 [Nodularia harveyana UHCC-0300]|uniref:Uncharacterized protein n=1 Tax=Nodularia harveyana UHCC-0300 TaxID=2974287 RepID=A0ABU5UBV8_9CYAN|nr:hypothetical protein [Nodularia harveyana]MEA5581007.1 hypothetical protein [Nodularia harveyana UHCC-0300]